MPVRVVAQSGRVGEVTEVEPLCLAGDVTKFLDDIGIELVHRYFDPASRFSGAAFDTFAGGGDAVGHRNAFTAEDLVAVTLLDVEVPGHAALAILDHESAEFSDLLAEIPVDIDLWDASLEVVSAGSSAATLWDRLNKLTGIGWVTANKLMARKRPRLLPVYDAVVKAALQPKEDSFWLPLRQEMQDETLVRLLVDVRTSAGLRERIPLLRVLDVAVWMRNRQASDCPLRYTRCAHRT